MKNQKRRGFVVEDKMAKAKRAKIVHLTRVVKKGKEHKNQIFSQVQDAVYKFDTIWLFSVENTRNNFLKDIRTCFPSSRFFIGKNKLIAKAMGSNELEQIKDGLCQLSEKLVGNVGLVFTNNSDQEIQTFFNDYEQCDYARAGCIASETIILHQVDEKTPVKRISDGEPLSATVESQLREAGMPIALRGGHIILLNKEYTVCTFGECLTAEQSRILKTLDVKMAKFKIKLMAKFKDGVLEEL